MKPALQVVAIVATIMGGTALAMELLGGAFEPNGYTMQPDINGDCVLLSAMPSVTGLGEIQAGLRRKRVWIDPQRYEVIFSRACKRTLIFRAGMNGKSMLEIVAKPRVEIPASALRAEPLRGEP